MMPTNPFSSYGFSNFDGTAVAGGVTGFLLVFVILFYLLVVAFAITVYILHAKGLYTIAKRRGLRNAWLSWIPLGDLWILGCISDQYQYMVKGNITKRRKVLLWTYIIEGVIFVPAYTAMTFSSFLLGPGNFGSDALAGAGLALILIAYIISGALAIVLAIFQYMCLYDLYNASNPDCGVLYLVLSILFSVATPFLTFAARKTDLGMLKLHPKYLREMKARETADEPAQAPAEPAPVLEAAAAEEVPAVDETPVEETPVEEAPVEEAPAEEIPAAEETPVVEGEIVESDPS